MSNVGIEEEILYYVDLYINTKQYRHYDVTAAQLEKFKERIIEKKFIEVDGGIYAAGAASHMFWQKQK